MTTPDPASDFLDTEGVPMATDIELICDYIKKSLQKEKTRSQMRDISLTNDSLDYSINDLQKRIGSMVHIGSPHRLYVVPGVGYATLEWISCGRVGITVYDVQGTGIKNDDFQP